MSKIERAAHLSLILIGIVAAFAALDYGEDLFAPIALALVAGVILSPIRDTLERIGLPNPVAALASFFSGLCVIVFVIMLFNPVAQRAIDAFPRVYQEVSSTLYYVQREMRGLERIERDVREMVDPDGDAEPTDRRDEGEGAADSIPTVEDVVFMAPALAAQTVVFLGVLFFFILTRTEIYAFAARRIGGEKNARDIALRFSAAERSVSRYFLTISAINLGLGLSVAGVMALLGMPSPWVWGTVAFLANFLLYVGPATLFLSLVIGGITVFDGYQSALPALAFLFMNFVESQFVTPTLLGRRLSVNPLLIFLSLAFFLWLWGAIGAIVAIPLLLWSIILTQDIRELRAAARDASETAKDMEPGAASAR